MMGAAAQDAGCRSTIGSAAVAGKGTLGALIAASPRATGVNPAALCLTEVDQQN